jgi:hypothetical protein
VEGAEEEVIVHSSDIQDDTIEVGRVGERGGAFLIELPQESATGKWRLWVPRSEVA